MHEALTERDWRDLLRLIHGREVVPVVGPDLATVPDATTGAHVPVRRLLAPALASELGLADPESYHSWNDVAPAPRRGRRRLGDLRRRRRPAGEAGPGPARRARRAGGHRRLRPLHQLHAGPPVVAGAGPPAGGGPGRAARAP